MVTTQTMPEKVNGFTVTARVVTKDRSSPEGEHPMCPLEVSMDQEMCDTVAVGVDRSLMPEGTVCIHTTDNSEAPIIVRCVRGTWESENHLDPSATRIDSDREKRALGSFRFVVPATNVKCLFLCQPAPFPQLSVSCPIVPTEIYTDKGNTHATVTWGRVTSQGIRPVVARTQGNAPESSFSEGQHWITYMVKDTFGQTRTCSFGFNVRVRRCSDWHTYYLPNGVISCTNSNIYGSTCRYSCFSGYTLLGSNSSTCEQTGWTDTKPSCSAISCGQPPRVVNGRVNCGNLGYRAQCHIFCNTSGYILQGSSKVECQDNGQWTSPGVCTDVTPPTFKCTPQMLVNAGPLKQPAQVDWPMPAAPDNSNGVVSVTSDPVSGTVLAVGVHQVTFTSVDSSGNKATCFMSVYVQVVKCSSSQLAERFSEVSCSQENIYGSDCRVNCSDNYYLEGEGHRYCLENGSWSGQQAKCLGLPCQEPPEVANGNFTCEQGYNYGEICTLTCQKGFLAIPPWTITCDINWSTAGHCQDVESPDFPDGCPPDMTLNASRLGELTLASFQLPHVTDNSGQPLDVSSEPLPGSAFDLGVTNVTVTAQDPSGNMATCTFYVKVAERSCDPPNFDPIRKFLRYNCPNGHQFGATCSLSCPNGTELADTITCDEASTGQLQWTTAGNATPSCPDEVCPPLPHPEHGYLECETAITRKRGPLEKCRVKCNAGYSLFKTAKDFVQCFTNIGRWSGTVSKCIQNKNPDKVEVYFKALYNFPKCTKDEANLKMGLLEKNLFKSKLYEVCPIGVNCPVTLTSFCRVSSGIKGQAESVADLEVTLVIDLGAFDETFLGQNLYNELELSTQNAVTIADDDGLFDIPGAGAPVSFTLPRLNFSCSGGRVFTSATYSCVVCGPGYRYKNETLECEVCSVGTYQDALMAFTCSKCPAGTTTIKSAATSSDLCIEICSPGSMSTQKTGLAPCSPCDVGTYQNESMAKSCVVCPFGMTTLSNGSVSVAECQFFNIRLAKDRPVADVTLPTLTSGSATFMMWVHLPVLNPTMSLTFNLDPSVDQTGSAYFTIGHVKLYLDLEETSLIRTWYHVTLILTQGNTTLVVDGEAMNFTADELADETSLGFTASDTIKSVVITGVQLSNSILSLEEITQYSQSCHKRLDDNVLMVSKPDKSLITPSTCDDTNNCDDQTCNHHGFCVDGADHVTCVCDDPWYGSLCEKVPDYCNENQCHNESICISETDLKKYTCQCSSGRKGTLCQELAVNGLWSEWEPWGACTAPCGQGERTRHRACDNPPPDPEGEPCTGEDERIESCVGTQCPVLYGQWGQWSNWTCSVTCGTGLESRTRECISLSPEDGGKCLGDADQQRPCNLSACPIDGQFGDWTTWSPCSTTCGGGVMTRDRKCDSPAPSQGGQDCNMSEARDTKSCNQQACPVCANLTFSKQILKCKYNTKTSLKECSISCGVGHELVPPEPKQIKCGLPTNYTWSHQTKDNPLGKIPKCSKAKPPSNQTVIVKYKCIGCPPATSSPAKKIINSTKNSLKTSNVCGKKTQCNVKTASSKQGRKRSTESMYLVVTLELDLTDENRKNISHDEAETLIREFETSAVKLFNSSQEIFQLKVSDTQFNGYIESAEAEVICHEGSGFYNGMCVDCPEGTYSLGNGSCFLCNKGYYQEEPRQSQCQPCPEGLTTSGMGSVYKTECQKNPPTYEDIFWWVSDDEEIFENLDGRRNTNDKVKFISGEDMLLVAIVVSATIAAIVIITIIAYIALRSKQQLALSQDSQASRIQNPLFSKIPEPAVENIYTKMSESLYDSPGQEKEKASEDEALLKPVADAEQGAVPEALASIELLDPSELKAVAAVNKMFEL
ncbi:sushi von Willebrand factor type A EGF and pentraxin domain-containing protein 1 [Biomphalaria glabrata]|nr:sushi; von Willebrand factor type A; EGF and pentraxin domain-containing protein 1-like [Biomphalaria glabrata]